MKLLRSNLSAPQVWSSFDRLHSLRDLFDSAFALAANPSEWDRGWAPAMDVTEDADKFTVQLELAGMKKEDFDITLENDTLVISGERKQESESGQGESFRSERFYGSFRRTVALPSPVQANKIQAQYQNGILSVELPKAEEAKPKKIEVSVS